MSFCLAGVMGWPIHHSLSPRLHSYWMQEHGLKGAYVPLAVPPDRLGPALTGLEALGFRGVNVTIPYKESVLPFMKTLTPVARRIGAVNLVIVAPDGSLTGDSTDGAGLLGCLDEKAPGWDELIRLRPAVVLGAGGAARAIVDALLQRGALCIRLLNRTSARAYDLAEAFGSPVEVADWGNPEALEGAGLIVNTTSLGMAGQPPLELDLSALPRDAVVFDAVYTPSPTNFLTRAAEKGARTVDGLGMLLHQAVPSFEAWFGVRPAVTPALRAHVLQGLSGGATG